jgi:hypothetical protein
MLRVDKAILTSCGPGAQLRHSEQHKAVPQVMSATQARPQQRLQPAHHGNVVCRIQAPQQHMLSVIYISLAASLGALHRALVCEHLLAAPVLNHTAQAICTWYAHGTHMQQLRSAATAAVPSKRQYHVSWFRSNTRPRRLHLATVAGYKGHLLQDLIA